MPKLKRLSGKDVMVFANSIILKLAGKREPMSTYRAVLLKANKWLQYQTIKK